MPRVGLVGPLPPPAGGMAMQTQQLARLLAWEGVSVELLQTNPPWKPAFIGKVKGLRALFRLLPYLWNAWRLCGRVDVIHLMANSGWSWQLFAAPVVWIGWLRKTPVIVNYRGGEAEAYLQASASRVKPTMQRASALVVPSGFLEAVFARFGIDASIIPNIIDLDTFRRAGEKAQASTVFSVVITRNLEPIYGLDTAIRAIALVREHVPGAKLQIAGSGPQKQELEQLVQQLGLEGCVSFLGRLDRAAIVDLYHSADVMLNPSTVDNMPNSVLESLACGVPVVSTNVGGVPYMVRDAETALLVEPGNEKAMADAILKIWHDSNCRDTLVENGLGEASRYSWQQIGPQWMALYAEWGKPA